MTCRANTSSGSAVAKVAIISLWATMWRSVVIVSGLSFSTCANRSVPLPADAVPLVDTDGRSSDDGVRSTCLPIPVESQFGEPCLGPDDCPSGLCALSPESPRFCTLPCKPNDPNPCPECAECRLANMEIYVCDFPTSTAIDSGQ